MRRFILCLAAAAGLLPLPDSAAAQAKREPKAEAVAPAKPDPGKPDPAKPDKTPRATLEDLFTRLAAAKDEAEANGIANLIERRWSRSGSDTADLLLSRAGEALKGGDHPLAVELLDRTLALKPDWAEAWNRRATAFFLLDDPASAMADIRQVLAREPRHFGALAGLGHIYMAGGDKKRALDAYKRALAIHPHIGTIRSAIDRLQPEIEGRDI